MEVTGKVVVITPKNQISDKFCKRDIVIETNEDYPQKLSIQFVQDKCEILDNFLEGQEVKIGVNLRGREWTNPQGEVKYFNTIQGWYIDAVDNSPQVVANNHANEVFKEDIANQMVSDQEIDDVPF